MKYNTKIIFVFYVFFVWFDKKEVAQKKSKVLLDF